MFFNQHHIFLTADISSDDWLIQHRYGSFLMEYINPSFLTLTWSWLIPFFSYFCSCIKLNIPCQYRKEIIIWWINFLVSLVNCTEITKICYWDPSVLNNFSMKRAFKHANEWHFCLVEYMLSIFCSFTKIFSMNQIRYLSWLALIENELLVFHLLADRCSLLTCATCILANSLSHKSFCLCLFCLHWIVRHIRLSVRANHERS